MGGTGGTGAIADLRAMSQTLGLGGPAARRANIAGPFARVKVYGDRMVARRRKIQGQPAFIASGWPICAEHSSEAKTSRGEHFRMAGGEDPKYSEGMPPVEGPDRAVNRTKWRGSFFCCAGKLQTALSRPTRARCNLPSASKNRQNCGRPSAASALIRAAERKSSPVSTWKDWAKMSSRGGRGKFRRICGRAFG